MTDKRTHPTFHGDGGTLFGIHLQNFLLTLITLGIYSFWAKANVRRYLYAQTALGGDRFTYDGTGGELLRGAFKAGGLVALAFILALVLSYLVADWVGALVAYGVAIFFIFPLAVVGSRRYRLSRTSWRGVRFSFRGEYAELLRVFIPGLLLSAVTLGIYYPFFHASVRRFVVDSSRFGNGSFGFDGSGGDLLMRHLALYVALPLTLGLYWFWHVAHRDRYYWSHTRFNEARFESTMDGGELLGFTFVNVLLVVFTAGLAFPWVQDRTMRFRCERLHVSDLAAFDSAAQDAQTAGVAGEGLAEMFDVELAGADFFGL